MFDAKVFSEKRVHPRVQVGIPVKYKLIEDHGEIKSIMDRQKKNQEAKTVDISLGGMYIVSKEMLRSGNLLKIDMILGGTHGTLIAFAEVIWSNETGAGLKYLSMKDDDVETLKTFISGVS